MRRHFELGGCSTPVFGIPGRVIVYDERISGIGYSRISGIGYGLSVCA